MKLIITFILKDDFDDNYDGVGYANETGLDSTNTFKFHENFDWTANFDSFEDQSVISQPFAAFDDEGVFGVSPQPEVVVPSTQSDDPFIDEFEHDNSIDLLTLKSN